MGTETSTDSTDDKTTTTTTDATTDTGKSDKDTGKDGAKDKGGASSDADKAADKTADDAGLKKALQATRKERDDLAKQIRDGELAKLPELERYKTLSEELTKENAELKLDNQRRQVAMEMNLPWKIGKRLTGDTIEEMRDDAADLAKDYKAEQKANATSDSDPKNRAKTKDTNKSGGSVGPSINDKLRALAGRTTI